MWLFSRLLLFVLAGSYTLPAVHLAFAVHEVCAEHGTFEHAHGNSEALSTEPSENTALSVSAVSSHEHDCCGAAGISPPSALAKARALAVPMTLGPARAIALREAPAKANVALLSYAPKLAPPV